MKTLLMFGSATVLAVSTLAVELTSSNVLGIQRTCKAANEQVVAQPFSGCSGTTLTLQEALYRDNLAMADSAQVMLSESDGYYLQWLWVPVPGYMDAMIPTTRNNKTAPEAKNQLTPPGTAIKISRADSSNPIYVMGQYEKENPVQLKITKAGTSLLINPSSTEFDLEAKLPMNSGCVYGDTIEIGEFPDNVIYKFDDWGDDAGHCWYRTVKTWENNPKGGSPIQKQINVYDCPKIGPGVSFVFKHIGSSPVLFKW